MKITWVDKISNEEDLAHVNKTRNDENCVKFYMGQETSLDRTFCSMTNYFVTL